MDIMKKILVNTVLIIGLSTLFGLNACKDDIPPVIDEPTYSRAFSPIGLTAGISSVTTLTLTWTAAKNIDHYSIEIFIGTDSTDTANKIYTTDVTTTTLVYILPSGDTQFMARLRSVSSMEGVAASKWTDVLFKSSPENLFTNYKVSQIGLNNLTVKWTPGKAVTRLLFINNGVEQSFDISADEATAGSKDVTGITKGVNEIRIQNGNLVRGKQSYTLEGDAYLAAAGDLVATIAGMTSGGVLIVESGASFGFAAPLTISQNIKIKGANSTSLPTIYPLAGASTTLGMFYISATDSIVFQNVILTGYIGNVVGATNMVTAVFDMVNTNACNIGLVKFKNCVIQHYGRHLTRLRGTASQIINSFVLDNCITNDFGSNTSSRGFIASNTAQGKINSILVSNSTFYSFSSEFIIYSNATASQGITINNCTFNQLSMDAVSARYLIDLNATASTGPVNITNCIFGSTSTIANGIRPSTMVLTMNNCYYTSDFNDGITFPIKAKMTAYNGLSTALWTDTSTGIFTFKDATFAGKNSSGDPRWR